MFQCHPSAGVHEREHVAELEIQIKLLSFIVRQGVLICLFGKGVEAIEVLRAEFHLENGPRSPGIDTIKGGRDDAIQ